jgi:hypothetical protein
MKTTCRGVTIPTIDEYPPGTFDFSFPSDYKREGDGTRTRLLGSRGAKPLQFVEILTDGMEDETEEINGVGQIGPARVCNLNTILKDNKGSDD